MKEEVGKEAEEEDKEVIEGEEEEMKKEVDDSNKINSSNLDGVGSKDPIYKSILEKNTKLKDRIEEVAKYIYQYDKMFFYFSDEGKESWIEREYPEVKSKRKLIIKRVNQLCHIK